jgi:antitoxin ParD1/3/4
VSLPILTAIHVLLTQVFCPTVPGCIVDVQLTPDLEELVQRQIETGRYSSASEVVRGALVLMQERDQQRVEIRDKIARARVSQRMGRLVDGEAVFDRLELELDALEDQGA